MRTATVNPLLLLILLQALARVKKLSPESSHLELSESKKDKLDLRKFSGHINRWLEGSIQESDFSLDEAAWISSRQSPLVTCRATSWLSPSHLARSWGSPGYYKIQLADLGSFLKDPPSDVIAIALGWMPEWEIALPEDVLSLILWTQSKDVGLWMVVHPLASSPALSEDILRRSTQLGWSWWCEPPTRSDEFPGWFQTFRPAFGYWLCSPTSDQWAWPWMDIISKQVFCLISSRPSDRPWVMDSRQKSAWAKVEGLVWDRSCEVLGGSEYMNGMLSQTILRLLKENG